MDKQIVERLATMIKLDLSESEIQEYSQQLNQVLDYLKHLQVVPTQTINYAELPSTQGQADQAVLSDDSLRQALKEQFSKESLGYLEVPAVFKENKEFKFKQE